MELESYKNYPFYNFHAIKGAYIHISDTCNFRCKTCRLPLSKRASFVPTKIIMGYIEKADSLGLNNLMFIGQEVILHPEIDKIIEFSFSNLPINYITFNTNGLAFSSDKIKQKLKLIKKYLNKLYIAVSVNFYDEKTFHNWSGCKEDIFKKWCLGIQTAVDNYPCLLFDTILKKDIDVIKILDFLSKLTKAKSHKMNLRILDLMPFGFATKILYKKLKFRLTEVIKIIPDILKRHKGKIEFESFPICIYNQKDLKDKKYYFYNFYICYNNGSLIQYDPNIYETYFTGPMENLLIDREKLSQAYKKMFIYLDECRGCYYQNQCYGIQREYIKLYDRNKINEEIKLSKRINWI